jgi:hypothetical protein
MQILLLTFNDPLNTSLQIGDIVYYSSTTTVPNSGFSTASPTIIQLGTVISINNPLGLNGGGVISIEVMFNNDPDGVPNSGDEITPPSLNDYIMFGKNKIVNSSSMAGYYAQVDFKNYSTDKIELFSVGSEISESSK